MDSYANIMPAALMNHTAGLRFAAWQATCWRGRLARRLRPGMRGRIGDLGVASPRFENTNVSTYKCNLRAIYFYILYIYIYMCVCVHKHRCT